jgi:hypothetical protein
VLSSGWLTGICSLNANISEHCVCSIFIGGRVGSTSPRSKHAALASDTHVCTYHNKTQCRNTYKQESNSLPKPKPQISQMDATMKLLSDAPKIKANWPRGDTYTINTSLPDSAADCREYMYEYVVLDFGQLIRLVARWDKTVTNKQHRYTVQ